MLGAGAVTVARHLPALRAVAGRPVSVFDPSPDAAGAAAERFGIPCVAASFEQAIEHSEASGVLVASPNSFHREQVEFALGAGRHVLCEKPVALSLEDARAMRGAAERAGRVLQIGFHHRFSSEHRCAKQLLEAGLLGEVRAFSGTLSEPLDVIPGGVRNYRFDRRLGGGLTLVDVGQHRIDQLRDLVGDVASLACEMDSVLPSHDCDDNVVLSLRMESGAIGSLSWNRFSRAFTSPLMVFGTEGTLGCSAMIAAPYQSAPVAIHLEQDPASVLPPDILQWTRPGRWWGDLEPGWVNIWPPRARTFELQWRSFFRSIDSGSPPVADGRDGLKALEIVQAAYQARSRREWVDLPLPAHFHCDPPRW